MLDYRRFKEINDLFAKGQPEKARHLLMELQSRCIALRDELDMLKIRIQAFEDILYFTKNLYKENGFYWLKTAGVKQGPFCPQCYAHERALIPLEKSRHDLRCPYCNTAHTHSSPPCAGSNHQERQAKIIPFAG
ncbi:MAG: hypothetical protein ZNDK_0127 [Candidatus Desulfovibrio kirbyi]|jgi:hypothetical protein|uniref:Uncharacterized protein n=1 Tax=Candidatus Desulfovibrio kirbyi TaxID=2696086 RepID=A0A6L2R462_9BACT|nr:hypothetical protein [Desulfovibrio sp.]GFH62356.1 MAG: hypothetical protein ZNDK_0127 [Candidatus Desulfovibrio kirbyi]